MSHNFIDSKRQEGDIVLFQKKVEEKFKALKRVEIELPFESDCEITSVKVLDNWNDGTGGHVDLISGGVGHKFVKFLLKSQLNRGFSFDVEIWGKPHLQHCPPPHHHSHPPPHHHGPHHH